MLDAEKKSTIDCLRAEVNRIARGGGSFRDVRALEIRSPPAAPREPLRPGGAHVSFGRWLLQQSGNYIGGRLGGDGGLRADLIAYAMADRGFPKDGSPEDVRQRMSQMGADGNMHAALDDAELDWSCW